MYENACLSILCDVDGQKVRFWNAMMLYIIQGMTCKGCYHISTVLAFRVDGRKFKLSLPPARKSFPLLKQSY